MAFVRQCPDEETMNPGVAAKVKAFYELIPFNCDRDEAEQAEAISAADQAREYPAVASLIDRGEIETVLDAGCGVGWFANSVAYWHAGYCTGVDFCGKALERARLTADRLGISGRTEFVYGDIFDLSATLGGRSFDLVNSLGVLHHTRDCRAAFDTLVPFVKPGGYIHIGLYHRYGRKALLDAFAPYRERISRERDPGKREAIESEGFLKWKSLHHVPADDVFLKSWYRDQCFHPHETQWTLADVLLWFAESGITPVTTSLDRFSPHPEWESVVAGERGLEDYGSRMINENRFFPGFFVVLGRKKECE